MIRILEIGMNGKYYAGIGSRETPTRVLQLMIKAAQRLAQRGYTLRSGGADGADAAAVVGLLGVLVLSAY